MKGMNERHELKVRGHEPDAWPQKKPNSYQPVAGLRGRNLLEIRCCILSCSLLAVTKIVFWLSVLMDSLICSCVLCDRLGFFLWSSHMTTKKRLVAECMLLEWVTLTGISEAMLRFLFQVFYWRASIYTCSDIYWKEESNLDVRILPHDDYLLEFCNDDHYCSCLRPWANLR